MGGNTILTAKDVHNNIHVLIEVHTFHKGTIPGKLPGMSTHFLPLVHSYNELWSNRLDCGHSSAKGQEVQ